MVSVNHEGAQRWSWFANWALLVMKLIIAVLSNSKAVWAAFAGESGWRHFRCPLRP